MKHLSHKNVYLMLFDAMKPKATLLHKKHNDIIISLLFKDDLTYLFKDDLTYVHADLLLLNITCHILLCPVKWNTPCYA